MKPLNIFKMEDFNEEYLTALAQNHSNYTATKNIAERANEILNQYLEKNGVRVSGERFNSIWDLHEMIVGKPKLADTHQALLINIEEIKKCEHKEAVYVESHPNKTWFECRDCGKALKPKGWEEEK